MKPGVEVRRGDVVESAHRVHVAVTDARGDVVRSVGDASLVSFLRSSAKPLQAVPLVAGGAADRHGLTAAELAVVCASHAGEPRHVDAVRRVLARVGLDDASLRCGSHAPRSPDARATPIHHNCSGNHAGLILLQHHLGGDVADYWRPDAAAQRAVVAAVAEIAGEAPRVGVDGCGIPAFALPLRAAARAFARLALPQGVSKETADALARIRDAMTSHPEMVGGAGSFDTALMNASEDRLVSKSGAEGYQCVGDLATGMGLALKVEDGDPIKRAVPAATIEILRQLGWLEPRAFEVLGDWWRPPVTNFRGDVVGEVRPVLELQ